MNRRPNLIPAAVLIVLGLAVGGYGGWQLRQSAARYQATAGVRVIHDQTDLAPLPEGFPAGVSESVFLQNQAEVIRSQTVLNKVVEKLDLTQEWGQASGADERLKTAEAADRLRHRLTAYQQPGSAVLQIAATGETPAQAQLLANTVAAAFCEARLEQRQRVAQAAIDAVAAPLQENETKYQQATAHVATARAALDPAIRTLDSPPPPTESDALRALRQELSRLTMIVMVKSNQLTRVQSLPAEDLQKLTGQFTETTNRLNEIETAIQTELQKQETLKNFWDARQELDQVNTILTPIKKAIAENRSIVESTNPAATVAEPADTAVKLPARNPVAFGCLIGAVLLLLTGAWLLGGKASAKA